ncbi:MAG: hypothetical protein AAB074_05800 [Planctomycetota bacterium]
MTTHRLARLFLILMATLSSAPARAQEAPDREQLELQVKQLADEDPAKRDQAESALEKAGDLAEAPLRAALAGEAGRGAEATARAKRLLARIDARRRSRKLAARWGTRWFKIGKGEETIGVLRLETRIENEEIVCDDTYEYFGNPGNRVVTRLAGDGTMAFRSFEVTEGDDKEAKVTKFDAKLHGADAMAGGFAAMRFAAMLPMEAGFEHAAPFISPWSSSLKISSTITCVGERDGAILFRSTTQSAEFTGTTEFRMDADGVMLSYRSLPTPDGEESARGEPCTEKEAAAARAAAEK